jgi:RsbT co-antagonist protein rsbRD N-terminal domain
MPGMPAEKIRAFAERWLALTFETYPPATRRFLMAEKDVFRNPIGATLREGIPRLAEELCGEMNGESVTQALEGIVRIRAVQDFSARRAVEFLFLAKQALQEMLPGGVGAELESRVDEMALTAFDLYVRCREQLFEVRLAESRRQFGMLGKIYSGERGGTVMDP